MESSLILAKRIRKDVEKRDECSRYRILPGSMESHEGQRNQVPFSYRHLCLAASLLKCTPNRGAKGKPLCSPVMLSSLSLFLLEYILELRRCMQDSERTKDNFDLAMYWKEKYQQVLAENRKLGDKILELQTNEKVSQLDVGNQSLVHVGIRVPTSSAAAPSGCEF